MNIFFIFPSIGIDKTVNHGIASLCSVIKEKGHEVDIYHPDRININELYKKFGRKEYSLCLISAVTNQWLYALEIIKSLRKISDIMIIVGGHHATNSSNILQENEEIDGICIGEGDIALGELLDKLEKEENYYHIKNLWFRKRKTGKIIKNEIGNLIGNLDDLPFPNYSVFSERTILNYPALMFSRGCPYNCTYCCNNSLRKLYTGKGNYIRAKSVKRAIEEVGDFVKKYNPPVLNFDDDTFIKDKKWLYSFLDEYKKITKIPFNCNTRPETLNEETCRRLKKANCRSISIGIESGNEQLRKERLKRHMSNKSIKEAFDMVKRHKIKTSSFNMVGIPDETYQNYWDTVKLNREINPGQMQISIFYPYPGTELGDYAKKINVVSAKNKFSHSYFSKSILNMKQFPRWKVKYAYLFFHFNVFKSQSIIKALYYFLRYNLLKKIYIKKFLKAILKKPV